MPELPEVETVARGLQKSVAGRRIVSVTLTKTDFMDDPAAIERELPGALIERVERFGKFMLLRLASQDDPVEMDRALLVHLGMTGNLAPHFADQPFAAPGAQQQRNGDNAQHRGSCHCAPARARRREFGL
jgi:formamidopyrimidine-DNA glycosylase